MRLNNTTHMDRLKNNLKNSDAQICFRHPFYYQLPTYPLLPNQNKELSVYLLCKKYLVSLPMRA